MSARLERRYRRLLRVYPAGQRRDELLGTLMEMAPADRRRPAPRESADLVRRGLRARLGRPASRSVVVMAVLVALVTGYLAAAVAVRAAWEAVPDYPTGGRLAEITGTVYPGLPVAGERSADGLFSDVREPSTLDVLRNGHDEEFSYATYWFSTTSTYLQGDYHAWVPDTARRLTEAGWTVRDEGPVGDMTETGTLDENGRGLSAERDGLTLRVDAQATVSGAPSASFWTKATLTREPPWYVWVPGVLGWLLGGLAGWLLTGWASRRTEGAGAAVRALSTGTAGVALLLLLPSALLGLAGFADEFWITRPADSAPFWWLTVTYGLGLSELGGLLGVIALGVAAYGGRARQDLPVPG